MSLLERVWRIAKRAALKSTDIVIATDSKKILRHAKQFGAKAMLSAEECRTGSDRVREVLKRVCIFPDVVVNLQGDTPLVPPRIVRDLLELMKANPKISVATPAVPIKGEDLEVLWQKKKAGDSGGTLVVFDRFFNALYFSKGFIPFFRDGLKENSQAWLHMGIYAWKPEVLEKFAELPSGNLEECEKLEQLRLIERGMPIRIMPVDLGGRKLISVDSPEDVKKVEEILFRDGDVL